jgi:hypothetical protein
MPNYSHGHAAQSRRMGKIRRTKANGKYCLAVAIGPFRPCTTIAESRLPGPVSIVLPRGHYLSVALIARSTFGAGAPKLNGGISHARNPKIQKMSPCVQFFRPERSLIFPRPAFGSGGFKYQISERPL